MARAGLVLGTVGLVTVLSFVIPGTCSQAGKSVAPGSQKRSTVPFEARKSPANSAFPSQNLDKVEAAVIHPYRSANVGVEVRGIVGAVNHDVGDRIAEGTVVVEIVSNRYERAVRKAEQKVKGLQLALEGANRELKTKKELLSLNTSNRQEVERAETRAAVAKQMLLEAEEDLALARLDLSSCKVKAPFSGHLVIRYRQPHEPVERLDKLFALADGSRVYAVANVPESILSKYSKGSKAIFVHASGKKFAGTVEKLGWLIDPESRTMKVYVLIDNPGNELKVGTTGSIELP